MRFSVRRLLAFTASLGGLIGSLRLVLPAPSAWSPEMLLALLAVWWFVVSLVCVVWSSWWGWAGSFGLGLLLILALAAAHFAGL